jgi:hypothetical protein
VKNRYTSGHKKFVLILVCVLFVLYPIVAVSAQSGTVVSAAATSTQPHVGDTLTVTITISNVQNLYGVDMQLNWNSSVLQLISNSNASFLGVESNSGGVLHTTSTEPIYYAEADASQATGEYDLVATSVAPSPAFSGSGTIATIKFNVISTGSAGLALQTDLSNYNPAGASLITHTDTADSVTAIAAGASSTPTSSPTNSPTSSPSSTPTPTPEFPLVATLSIILVLASVAIVLSVRKIIKPTPVSGIKPQV